MKVEYFLLIHTTVQSVPGVGPSIQFGSNCDVTRSGVGKQIGRTHRLNVSGFSSRNNATSLIIAKVKKNVMNTLRKLNMGRFIQFVQHHKK